MAEYTELIKALRIRSGNLCSGDICDRCEAFHFLCSDKVMHDAASAIEDLQAEVDALAHDIKRYVRINAKLTTENEALQAELYKYHELCDVDEIPEVLEILMAV